MGMQMLIGRSWLAPASDAVRARLEGMEVPVFPLQGKDVLALGVAPGPRVGELLRGVREVWLESGCGMGEAELRARFAEAVGG